MTKATQAAKLLLRRRVRFVLDVEVFVRDMPQALIDGNAQDTSYDELPKEDFIRYMEFQERFLQALLSTDKVASKLIIDCAGLAAAEFLDREYMQYYGEADEDVFAPVISKLLPQDRDLIREAISNELFAENTEVALFDSFKAKVTNYSIEERQ